MDSRFVFMINQYEIDISFIIHQESNFYALLLGQPTHFLVSHASGCMYVYNEELQSPQTPPSYQIFKQVTNCFSNIIGLSDNEDEIVIL